MSSKTQSIGEDSLVVFKQTCDKPYDRHHYRINHSNGQSVVVGGYELAKHMWYQLARDGIIATIDVVDPVKNKDGGKGF